ncbi:methylglutaconyl-CoA hydratase, mitochondrial-like [Varroa jacobsoni]|uniref:methylglutaconyl-CoA hydratase, mitochondrial-like n=1 Tax=Varroa jacobsoni TaxID=62625 RepID=UPI000BFA2139|nr:methylglutaconyl-CoA hydratase, mitochondrial-like [Varroa jacobsoni]XP_022700863.1 methylglutaconyl-CoA hydratase, mitochondrial-like [Varroa jacobsoni]XP_022700864.1 methylglutaconyl-CoA hydratase, mitochondrial-like [Varroa jacobsoni]XP_022700865.1 methylglutaconyl-CoA hydratase, mitochondrial-like [Varroa jacobsoni]XP_022700866.1 methylglutaconyl-CoA hydratase, mitochondrial-like [Varroa jacobsoni]XP_022700867.1 methylglutaconyl-CoA hydratase, mitochondrial-like [Varroa jacobsoni]XP_02
MTYALLTPFACRVMVASLQCSIRRHLAIPSASSQENEVYMEKLTGNHEGVAFLTMNRPEGKNSLSRNFLTHLEQSLQQLKNERSVRVLIMRSVVPGVFCAGADLKERRTMPEEEVEPFVERLRNVSSTLESLPMPTIAALDGAALGGGLELALACDIRVASQAAKMGLVETKLGIIPGAGGTQRLPRIIGPVLAKELILTSRVLNGKEARQIGLVNHVTEEGKTAERRALELAEEILPNAPIALRLAKLAVNKAIEVSLAEGLIFEKSFYAQVIKTKDRMEGLNAFREKRKPMYKGE